MQTLSEFFRLEYVPAFLKDRDKRTLTAYKSSINLVVDLLDDPTINEVGLYGSVFVRDVAACQFKERDISPDLVDRVAFAVGMKFPGCGCEAEVNEMIAEANERKAASKISNRWVYVATVLKKCTKKRVGNGRRAAAAGKFGWMFGMNRSKEKAAPKNQTLHQGRDHIGRYRRRYQSRREELGVFREAGLRFHCEGYGIHGTSLSEGSLHYNILPPNFYAPVAIKKVNGYFIFL